MTDIQPTSLMSSAAVRVRRLAAQLGRSLCAIVIARATRHTLTGLPDDILKDIGLTRGEIAFVANAIADAAKDTRCDACGTIEGTTVRIRAAQQWPVVRLLAAAIAAAAFVMASPAARAQDAQLKRGQYLVNLGLCTDCHTPGYFFGKPDEARFLGGSEVGFEIPGLGVFHGPNLTPDRETGLGNWSAEEIANAFTKGQRPDGRILAPIMPWHAFGKLSGEDVGAIAAFLKSLPPVKNKVPGPFGPGEQPTSFVMKVVPPLAVTPGTAAPK